MMSKAVPSLRSSPAARDMPGQRGGDQDGDRGDRHGDVLADDGACAPGQGDGGGRLGEVVGHQRDVGGLDGHVGAEAPIAMPTSAVARAGASLMPSPTMATAPRAAQRGDRGVLSSGSSPARQPVIPPRGDGGGGGRVVAGEHEHAADAQAAQRGDGPAAPGRSWSARPSRAAGCRRWDQDHGLAVVFSRPSCAAGLAAARWRPGWPA